MIIGVTGGIASGKTTVCRIFERQGALVVDADRVGREVVEQDREVLSQLAIAFGKQILTKNGGLDRRILGRLAFGDPVAKNKLDEIVHPLLLRRLREKIVQTLKSRPSRPVVVDAALIVEWNILSWFDAIVVVLSRREDQIRRLIQKGLSFKGAQQRLNSQLPSEEKVKKADFVIHNTGDYATLCERSQKVWEKLMAKGSKEMKKGVL
ncbi:MAG: dephospho-CoA kinase [Candidatus Latescibacteria bacterium]|nr:dephospho-CoA kinase [Candidatus Latescibacterota bacterium]